MGYYNSIYSINKVIIKLVYVGAVTVLAVWGFRFRGELAVPEPARPHVIDSASLTITTTSALPLGQIYRRYEVILKISGRVRRYTWGLASGQLPQGLTLDAATGKIKGTPTRAGRFTFTVRVADSTESCPTTTAKTFNVTVSDIRLDQYGGLVDKPSPNGGTGYFRVEKINNRWTLVTPDGDAFRMASVYQANEGFLDSTVIRNKYGGDVNLWAEQRNRRLLSWGFNTLGEYTSFRGLPVGVWGDPVPSVQTKLPFIPIMNGAVDAVGPYAQPGVLGLPEAIKSVTDGVPLSTFHDYRGPLVDAYDPKFAQAQAAEVAYWSRAIVGGFANKPWVVGITTDDADSLHGFKSRAGAPVNAYEHPGFMVAVTKFEYSAAENPKGVPWIDPKLYSKYAWIDFLKAKYCTINALNTAWGTRGFYTSFDDAGGYAVGTGVIDEDGRHTAWMGTMTYPFTKTGASPGVQADLDAFLYQFVKRYAQVSVSAIRAVDKNHLIFGPAAINNYGAKARDEVLHGLADGGRGRDTSCLIPPAQIRTCAD